MLLGVPVPTAGGLYRAREEVRAFQVAVAQSGLRLVLPHGLGRATFRRLLNDPRFLGVPMVLETPGPPPVWKRELRLLRGPVGRGRGRA
jgi:hypothetical protein